VEHTVYLKIKKKRCKRINTGMRSRRISQAIYPRRARERVGEERGNVEKRWYQNKKNNRLKKDRNDRGRSLVVIAHQKTGVVLTPRERARARAREFGHCVGGPILGRTS